MDETRDLLDKTLQGTFEKLTTLQVGSKEHAEAVDSLAKLYNLKIEETEKERAFMRTCESDVDNEREYNLKMAQFKDQVWDRRIGRLLEGLGISLPLMFGMLYMNKGFKFEETGTFTSDTFRWLRNSFRFKK